MYFLEAEGLEWISGTEYGKRRWAMHGKLTLRGGRTTCRISVAPRTNLF
jgi:hypothetical protein